MLSPSIYYATGHYKGEAINLVILGLLNVGNVDHCPHRIGERAYLLSDSRRIWLPLVQKQR